MSEKTCTGCGKTRPLEGFNRDRTSKDGRHTRCKTCAIAATRKWQKANPDREKAARDNFRKRNPEYRKRWEQNNPHRMAAKQKRARERHPEKASAREQLRRAIERGEVVKPDTCEDCGSRVEESRALHGHHDDYSKPLDVRWLCRSCHHAHHQKDPAHV